MKIAWFTPFQKDGSAIANFSDAIVAGLRDDHEVTVFASDLADSQGARRDDVEVVGLMSTGSDEVLARLDAFHLVVYNMGNYAPYHGQIYEFLQRRPGLVVLHDLVMRDLFYGYFLGGGNSDLEGLVRTMDYGHGQEGVSWLKELLQGRLDLSCDPNLLEYHMARAVVAHAHGVVTHSEFTRSRVEAFAGGPVTHIAFPAPPLAELALTWDPPSATPAKPVRLLTVGHVNRNKLVDVVIETIAGSPLLRESVVYNVAGPMLDTVYRDQLHALVADRGLGSVVNFLGELSDEALHEVIRQADVMVVLRKPHMGESSWSLLEALFAARATVVWDHGFYAEVPYDATRKVSGPEALRDCLEDLCRDPGLRNRLGREARRYAVETFNAKAYGRTLVEFAESVRRDRVALAMADRVARRIGDLPWFPGTLLDRVAGEISRLAYDRETAPDPHGRRARAELAAGRSG
jgi:glycosyltransferase involved in cell wall biosynthesis